MLSFPRQIFAAARQLQAKIGLCHIVRGLRSLGPTEPVWRCADQAQINEASW